MILLKKSKLNQFRFRSVKNDVINSFDETGNWEAKNFPVAFKIVNGSININKCTTKGLKPFEFEGNNFIAYLNKFHMILPNEDEIEIEYALIMSLNKFYDISKNVKEFVRDYVEYFEEKEGRTYFNQKYGEYIENPNSIGIIGVVDENEVKDFNRQEKTLPRWIEIIPYNYL